MIFVEDTGVHSPPHVLFQEIARKGRHIQSPMQSSFKIHIAALHVSILLAFVLKSVGEPTTSRSTSLPPLPSLREDRIESTFQRVRPSVPSHQQNKQRDDDPNEEYFSCLHVGGAKTTSGQTTHKQDQHGRPQHLEEICSAAKVTSWEAPPESIDRQLREFKYRLVHFADEAIRGVPPSETMLKTPAGIARLWDSQEAQVCNRIVSRNCMLLSCLRAV